MEKPCRFGRNQTLIGMLSTPDDTERPRADLAVVLLNAGILHRVGPFRWYVELSRRLSSMGFPVLRVDLAGKGDSERRPGLSRDESVDRDMEDIAGVLKREVSARRFVLVGLCSGADDAVRLMGKDDRIVGAALLDGYAPKTIAYYLHHYGPRALRLDVWGRKLNKLMRREGGAPDGDRVRYPDVEDPVNTPIRSFPTRAGFRRLLERLGNRNAKLLCIYTSGSHAYYNHQGQLRASMRLRGFRNHVRERYFPEARHTLPTRRHQREMAAEVSDWLAANFATPT